jgi:hypothetical protein
MDVVAQVEKRVFNHAIGKQRIADMSTKHRPNSLRHFEFRRAQVLQNGQVGRSPCPLPKGTQARGWYHSVL